MPLKMNDVLVRHTYSSMMRKFLTSFTEINTFVSEALLLNPCDN